MEKPSPDRSLGGDLQAERSLVFRCRAGFDASALCPERPLGRRVAFPQADAGDTAAPRPAGLIQYAVLLAGTPQDDTPSQSEPGAPRSSYQAGSLGVAEHTTSFLAPRVMAT
jgi:hypothetical protein